MNLKNILIPILLFSGFAFGQMNDRVLKAVNYDELKAVILQDDDKLYVVNFWATWCKPCVEELPGFMEMNEQFKDHPNFKMILVSLDSPRLLETKVKKFIERHKLDVDVYLLDDRKRANEWMQDIDPEWHGIIPVTVFYKNSKKLKFRPMTINKYELEDMIDEYLE